MKQIRTSFVAAIIASTALGGIAFAQGKQQAITTVDVQSISTGYRASKIIGSDVRNGADDKVGEVDDVVIAGSHYMPYAIISVGGFLGVGSKLVAVPYRDLQPRKDSKSFILPAATKDALKALPEFKYAQ
jgi:hypothetical protein